MKERGRVRRDEPVRTGPIRDFSQIYHRTNDPTNTSFAKAGAATEQQGSDDNTKASEPRSVAAAYRVIQKHLEEGRQAASQFAKSSSARRGVNDPFQQLLERLIALQSDVVPLVLDVMREVAQAPSPSAAYTPGSEASAGSGTRRTRSLIADVVGRRPVEIALELREDSWSLPLATPGLHTLDGSNAALREIGFVAANDNGPLRLRIVIPADQASGSYSGVVLNQVSGAVEGTISIKIKD